MENNVLYRDDKTVLVCPLYSINGKFKVIDSVKEIETLAFYGQNDINEIELSKNRKY